MLSQAASICRRGTVIGILKALLGLSASAYTTVYVAFLEPDERSFLLLLAIAPSAVALICVPFINFVPFIQIEPHTKVSPKCGSGFRHLHCLQAAEA